ncbi:hypothetical protein O181_044931 [Austropuccinia psidii MF-1]|uniref:Uncharacterized protein n=1 Tax=Austropuccinia psidii MF-1 TaxID=1389203 RepID=A0A9Q3DJ92_9BASI|nr:hypothetical protein [Austropuccinia psidii MF-1]
MICLQCSPHPALCLPIPASYHSHTPTMPLRHASKASLRALKICLQHHHLITALTSCILPHPHHLPCLCSHRVLKIWLQHSHHISFLTPPYASTPPPHPLCSLPCSWSDIRVMWYMLNPITEIGTTMAIHVSMLYPIYGNLAISIIIGQIGHFFFFGLSWLFHNLDPTWSLHHHQAFPGKILCLGGLLHFPVNRKIHPKSLYLAFKL